MGRIKKNDLLSEKVYRRIKEEIITHKLPPNTRLKEEQLAKELGVSRSPVREALRRLASEGYITLFPNRGAIINEISLKDVIEIYQIRGALFSLAGSLSSQNISEKELIKLEELIAKMETSLKNSDTYNFSILDEEFDNLILKTSKNKNLIEILKIINDRIRMIRFESLSVPGRMEKAFEELKKIFNAIKNRDKENAEKFIKEHSQNALNNIIKNRKIKN